MVLLRFQKWLCLILAVAMLTTVTQPWLRAQSASSLCSKKCCGGCLRSCSQVHDSKTQTGCCGSKKQIVTPVCHCQDREPPAPPVAAPVSRISFPPLYIEQASEPDGLAFVLERLPILFTPFLPVSSCPAYILFCTWLA